MVLGYVLHGNVNFHLLLCKQKTKSRKNIKYRKINKPMEISNISGKKHFWYELRTTHSSILHNSNSMIHLVAVFNT